jgi:hypothetical protein
MDTPLPDPNLETEERTVFRGFIDGEEVGTGSLTLKNDGAKSLIQEIEGAAFGRLAGAATVVFRRRGEELHAESQSVLLTHKGKDTFKEEASFRDVQVPQLGGDVGAYPRTMVPAAGLAVAFRALNWDAKSKFAPPVWLTAIVHWPLDLRVEKKESITVPAGKFEAFKIRVRPSLVDVAQSLDELSANLIPPVYVYVAVKPAGRVLKVDFPTGPGRNDPRGYIEATELS